MKLKNSVFILILIGILSLIGNLISTKHGIIESLPGMIILIAISIGGIALSKIMPGKIPAVAYIVTLGCIVTFPSVPGSAIMTNYINKINFLALTTPILGYVGLSIGKDLDAFKKSGWRIVILSIFVFIGTYLGSAVIAQIILKSIHQI